MTPAGTPLPSFWELLDRAMEVPGSRALHLAVGRPPCVRADGELRPLDGGYPVLTYKAVALLLSPVVEPEQWDFADMAGEGDFTISRGAGRPIRLAMFRSSGAWSAVASF